MNQSILSYAQNVLPSFSASSVVTAHYLTAETLLQDLFVVTTGIPAIDTRPDLTSRLGADILACELAHSWNRIFSSTFEERIIISLRQAFEAADSILSAAKQVKQMREFEGCSATCVLAYDQLAFIANVGINRVYHYDGNQLRQVTKDHSVYEYDNEAGHETSIWKNAVTAPNLEFAIGVSHEATEWRKHLVIQALGLGVALEPQVFVQPLIKGDKLLVCNVDVWRDISDSRLEQNLRATNSPDETVQHITGCLSHNVGTPAFIVINMD